MLLLYINNYGIIFAIARTKRSPHKIKNTHTFAGGDSVLSNGNKVAMQCGGKTEGGH